MDVHLPVWIKKFTREGGLTLTHKIRYAQQFTDHAAAWDFYTQELPQGMWGRNESGINRPLTAFTVKIYNPEGP
jgi:hypothetical protein